MVHHGHIDADAGPLAYSLDRHSAHLELTLAQVGSGLPFSLSDFIR